MKSRYIAMATLCIALVVASETLTRAQAQVEEMPNAKMTALPDLIVTGISYEANNKVRVRVLNQGKGGSARCYLALMMLSGGGPASAPQKVWTIEIPPLGAGKGYSTPISIAPRTWVDVAFKARVDRSDSVRETDENNNELFNNSKVVK